MNDPLLSVRQVFAGYAGRDVLRDISLDVHPGAFLSVIGPNGHGKSTLLKCISGLVRTGSGSIRFSGDDVTGLAAPAMAARGLVHVPQGDMLFADMTVHENLMMGAYLTSDKAVVRRRLDEVHTILPRLADRRRQLARTLSGGERRMVAIGRGLMAGGRLTMFDEPSLGLAPVIIDQIYEVMERLRASGRTIVLVEENAMRAARQSDRMCLLDNGAMVWQGNGEEFLARPEVIRSYLGG